MKKIIAIIITAVCALQLVGCGEKPSEGAKIDYGTSSLYTKEEMDEAVELIKELFDSEYDGCELHSITYGGDSECNAENIDWLNDIEKARDNEEHFTKCIMFKSNWHSPKVGYGSFEDDKEYTGWQWWLGRSEDGDWKFIDCGY